MLQTIFNGEVIQVYTEKTIKAIEKYVAKYNALDSQEKHYKEEARKDTYSLEVKRFYYDKANQIDGKKWKVIEKIDELKKDKFTYTEIKKLVEESATFQSLERGTNIGVRDYSKTGFSKYLNSYIKIEYSYFNSFMKSVKGCGGLANTYSLRSLILLSEEEYKALVDKPVVVKAFGTVATIKES